MEDPVNDKPNWLFMVYMVAGDSDKLDSLAVQDLLEMERGVTKNSVDFNVPKDSANNNVQVLVQVHRKWPANPQRYRIKKLQGNSNATTELLKELPPQPRPVKSGSTRQATSSTIEPVNMGDQETLTDFLLDALKTYQAAHYCLVLWGHSYGLGFGREHGDSLTLTELSGALKKFEEERHQRLDLLGTNTCTMAYAEAIFELRKSAKYMVASEVFVPFAGWPYTEILGEVTSQSPDELGSLIANRYVDFYNTPDRDERVAMTLLDLERAEHPQNGEDDLATLIAKLGNGIKIAIEGDPKADKRMERLQRIQDAFLINPAGQIRPVLDLVELAKDLTRACDEIVESEGGAQAAKDRARELVRELKSATEAVETILPTPPPDEVQPPDFRKLVLLHKRHPELSDLNGVGIFAPFVVEPRPLSHSELQLLELSGKREEELRKEPKADYRKLEALTAPKQSAETEEELRKKSTEAYPKPADSGIPAKPVVSKPDLDYGAWPDMVFDKLRPNRPAEIVDIAGVVRPADRSAVSHMVFAVDAAFRRLSRALRLSQGSLIDGLKQLKAMNQEHAKQLRIQSIAGFGPPNLKLARDLSMRVDLKKYGQEGKYDPADEPTEIVNALQSIEEAFSRVERISRRVVTDAQFGIGPAATPVSVSGGFDDSDKTIGAGFLEKTIGAGFAEKTIGAGFAEKTIGAGFAEKSIGAGFGPGDDDSEASSLGSRIAFVTADMGLGSLAVLHLFQSIARAFDQVEVALAGLEDEVARFLDPGFGAILSKTNYERAIEARIQRRFGVLQDTSLQALRIVRSVLAHPTFGLGPGPSSIGRGDREALATQAGLGRQRLLLL